MTFFGYTIRKEKQEGGMAPGATTAAVFDSRNECQREFGFPFAVWQARIWIIVQFFQGKQG